MGVAGRPILASAWLIKEPDETAALPLQNRPKLPAKSASAERNVTLNPDLFISHLRERHPLEFHQCH
jgi:hypothetical protein